MLDGALSGADEDEVDDAQGSTPDVRLLPGGAGEWRKDGGACATPWSAFDVLICWQDIFFFAPHQGQTVGNPSSQKSTAPLVDEAVSEGPLPVLFVSGHFDFGS